MANLVGQIRNELAATIDAPLVDELLRAYSELKINYYLGKHKPSELEGSHFAEVVIRLLQLAATGKYIPLGESLPKFDVRELDRYAQLPSANQPDSIRIHIPRAVFAIYGIRNRRGVGHVGGDVNPNLSDASLIVATCDWILAEIISLYYTSSREEAQKLVDTLVTRKVSLIQDFDGFLKVLNPKLSVPKQVLVLLYHRAAAGASKQELRQWVKTRPDNLTNALNRLEHSQKHIHSVGDQYFITRAGEAFVEEKISFHL
jgi:hypothetical protein